MVLTSIPEEVQGVQSTAPDKLAKATPKDEREKTGRVKAGRGEAAAGLVK